MNRRNTSGISRKDGIRISHISKKFEDEAVFSDFSLEIPSRGITAITGASGSGKTTLTRMLLGLCSPDSGEILNPYTRISCAFQDPRLLPFMTALDNVALVLTGIPKKDRHRIARERLTDFGLADALQKYPEELSGGMQQRVSLARAFLCVGELLILDEPFRGLDEDNKNNVIALIRRESLSRHVLLVTHDEKAAKDLGATIIRLPSHKE